MNENEENPFLYEDDEGDENLDIDSDARYIELLDEIRKRCIAAKITFENLESEDGEHFLKIQIPSGRDTRALTINHDEVAEDLLSFPFEKYLVIKGYDAICSYSDGVIEALIKQNGVLAPPSAIYRSIFGIDFRDILRSNAEIKPITLMPNDEQKEVQIILGKASAECSLLTGNYRSVSNPRNLSIRIAGIRVTQHDKALELLERISDSLFFEIDLTAGIQLSLGRTKTSPERRNFNKQKSKAPITFPKYEYNHEAMSLYWYARSARGMPLLQYLAYYQVIEVYFPIYSKAEAQKRIRNILKAPNFNPMNDLDIGKILSAIRANKNKGFGDERSQLKAVILECITADGIRSFLSSEEKRHDFFTSKQKTISEYRIPSLSNTDTDIRINVAERIYDIRCKIVHTKDDSGNEEETVGLLLPFSKEAELLTYDIEVIQYIAQQVLIASSTNLRYLIS